MQEKVLNNFAIKKKIDRIYSLDSLLESELSACVKEISANHALLIQHYDAESLHQMRVTLRRMLSLLDFFRNELPQQEWESVRELINSLFKPTSKIRDFEVVNADYIVPAYREFETSFQFRNLLNQSHGKLLRLYKLLAEELTSFTYLRKLKELDNWVQNRKWQAESFDSEKVTGNAFRKLIEKNLNRRAKKLCDNIEMTKKYKRKQLHKLRIEVKKLRYMMDILGISIKHRKKQQKFLKELQDLLGIINDSYIAEDIIEKEFKAATEIGHCREFIHKKSKHRRTLKLGELQQNF